MKRKKRKKKWGRTTYFSIGFSRVWKFPIHNIIKKLRDDFGLIWLQVRMSYRKFPNFRELVNGDLSRKMNYDINSRFFRQKPCDFKAPTRVNGKCQFNGNCNKTCVVYKITCQLCKLSYIGQTQNKANTRLTQHIGEAKLFCNKNKRSDSFASHFGSHIDKSMTPRQQADYLRSIMKCSLPWTGKIIPTMKTFRRPSCQLCMKERTLITKGMLSGKSDLINSSSELYGACRHKSRFHWLYVNGTDELYCERVNETISDSDSD